MKTWFECGEDDAKGAGDKLTLFCDRLAYARYSYNWRLNMFRVRRNVATYREYLQGFTSVLPFKLEKPV